MPYASIRRIDSNPELWQASADDGRHEVTGIGRTPSEAAYAARRNAARDARAWRINGRTIGRQIARKLIRLGHAFDRPERAQRIGRDHYRLVELAREESLDVGVARTVAEAADDYGREPMADILDY